MLSFTIMVFVKNWDDFESAADGMYQRSPDARFSMKYTHHKGELVLKLTDNVKVRWPHSRLGAIMSYPPCISLIPALLTDDSLQCIQYKTDIMPDLRKIEKFTGHLMGQMAKTD